MAKNYNISSKLDMRRFQKDLQATIMKEAANAIRRGPIQATCPKCYATVSISGGATACPRCGARINLRIDIK